MKKLPSVTRALSTFKNVLTTQISRKKPLLQRPLTHLIWAYLYLCTFMKQSVFAGISVEVIMENKSEREGALRE